MSKPLNHFEKEFEVVSREVEKIKKHPELKHLPEREIVRQAIKPVVPAKPSLPKKDEEKFLPDYLKEAPEEIKLKVEELIGEVFERGIKKTTQKALGYGPYFLDAFHDALVDKMLEELKKRGKI